LWESVVYESFRFGSIGISQSRGFGGLRATHDSLGCTGILAAGVMPWLAKQKRRLSAAAGSAALKADAIESAVCGYLALIALAGLTINAIWKVTWADPFAALALLPLIVHEGWEAMMGKPCC
jgi:divalent metal cation (Fe/Co/Zn/Cd) transporter